MRRPATRLIAAPRGAAASKAMFYSFVTVLTTLFPGGMEPDPLTGRAEVSRHRVSRQRCASPRVRRSRATRRRSGAHHDEAAVVEAIVAGEKREPGHGGAVPVARGWL